MKKLRLALLSLVTLATSLTSFGQAGTGWSLIPWVNPSESPTQGRRDVHLQKGSVKDFSPWFNQSDTYYFNNLTGSSVQGTYQYIASTKTEIFRHYGSPSNSVNRSEIRIKDDYNSGQARQLEGYVTFNGQLSADQAFLQIWGHSDAGATMLQLRGKGGKITASGRISRTLNPNFPDINYANREFKLNAIHLQETRNGNTIISNGKIVVYIDGILFLTINDNKISDDPTYIEGANYFKYGCYGTVESSLGNAQVIWKEARYFRDGNFPGTTPQTITFNPPSEITLNGGDVAPGATASSGLAVSYRSDNPAVAAIVNGKIRPVSEGSAKIWAYQDGNGTYAPAPVLVRTISVEPGTVQQTQTINFPALPAKLTTDAPFALNATASSGLAVSYQSNNTGVATISGNTVTLVGAGSANITAFQAGNASYFPADPVTRTLTVTAPVQQTQTINFPAISEKLITSPNFSPGATASSGLTVTYSSSNTAVAVVVGSQIDIVGAGTVTITANQAGNASYFPAPAVARTFQVKTPVTYYKLKLRAAPTLVLNATGTPANGTAVNVTNDTGANSQLWKVIPTTNGYVRIAPYANQAFALDCSEVAPVKGSPVHLWTYATNNTNLRQQWLRSTISGTTAEKVTLRATSTQGAMVLDCQSNPAVSGSPVQTWTYTAGDTNQRQQWIFEAVVRNE